MTWKKTFEHDICTSRDYYVVAIIYELKLSICYIIHSCHTTCVRLSKVDFCSIVKFLCSGNVSLPISVVFQRTVFSLMKQWYKLCQENSN